MGQYKEELPSGGTFTINDGKGWNISYYTPGPDRRYNGHYYTLYGDEIDKYINAWKENFKKYVDMKSVFKANGTYSTIGLCNMCINIGGYHDGVSLDLWQKPVNQKKEIEQIIADYEDVKSRAPTLMKMMLDMDK